MNSLKSISTAVYVQITGWLGIVALAFASSAGAVPDWVYWTTLGTYAVSVAAYDIWVGNRKVDKALSDLQK